MKKFLELFDEAKETRKARWDKMRVGYTKGDHIIVKMGGRTEKVHVTEVGKHNSTGKSADGAEHIFTHKEYFAHVNEEVVTEADGVYLHPKHPSWKSTVEKAANEYVNYREKKNIPHDRVMNGILYNSHQNVPKRHWDEFAKAVMHHKTVKDSGYKS